LRNKPDLVLKRLKWQHWSHLRKNLRNKDGMVGYPWL